MIRTMRASTFILPPLAAASWLLLAACSSNDPTTTTGAGGDTSTTAAVTTGAGGTNVTTGGVTTGATTSGGDTTVTTGATTGAGGGSGGMFTPLCAGLTTAANVPPTKNGACTATDPQLCYKTCGPQSVGFKSETCTGGAYAEQSGCTFPDGADYSCYKIPGAIDASCPTTAPKAGDACTVATCTLCNVGGGYLDSSGNPKTGYCVCPAPGAGGVSKWSCASATSWPCPSGSGC
jgi:hypothetical protein